MKPPPLKDDCFAMPPGVDWTPVDEALKLLHQGLHPVAEVEDFDVSNAGGRILAQTVQARRSNPPQPNSAVDGFGFAFASLPQMDPIEIEAVAGRAAAGVPFKSKVPAGKAIRILTGAQLPEGVDTVVLEEDTTQDGSRIAFNAGLKPKANTRSAGEDVVAGHDVFAAGHKLRAQDVALLTAVGVVRVSVRKPLRVGVLSTGDEIVQAGVEATDAQIFDANRPMLLRILNDWGVEAIDLGHVADDADLVQEALNLGATKTDAILTSGGASAGDEDHVSAVLREHGNMQTWRVALKPGRPVAMALWNGVPVFGLPGNPVAAFVCTLIFAYPALNVLAGAASKEPTSFMVPAAFSKNKKPGRREYLRARMRNGQAEVFKSEGSGRISGLSWAEGLVELPDEAVQIEPGTPVRYYPFSSFGLSD